jgi:hypothetical protein
MNMSQIKVKTSSTGMNGLLFMQFLTRAVARKPAKAGKKRLVETPRGKIGVLEYGFANGNVKPLYIDMHGGGFVLCNV